MIQLYIDNKMVLLASSLGDVIPEDVEFLSLQEMSAVVHGLDGVSDLRLLQGFIISKPKHAFLEKVIDLIIENIKTGYYGYTPVCPTGPRALGSAIQLVLNKKEVNPNWLGVNDISGFKFIFWPDQSLKYPGLLIGYDSNCEPIIQYSYNGYLKDKLNLDAQKDIGKFYRYAWYMDKIYSHGKVLRPKYNCRDKKIINNDFYRTCIIPMFHVKRYKELAKVIFYSIRKNKFSYLYFIKGFALMISRKIFRRI